MDMDYKITLYGDRLYKEIKLQDESQHRFKIGTTKDCQIRFFKEHFLTDFAIQVSLQQEKWIVTGNDFVYFKKNGTPMEKVYDLIPGDILSACYVQMDRELFTLVFSVDFEEQNEDYNRKIFCADKNEITIGGTEGCMIRVRHPLLEREVLHLKKNGEFLQADSSGCTYGVVVNGCHCSSNPAMISEGSIFSINGVSFYYSGGYLYTSNSFQVITSMPVESLYAQKNHLNYPKFIRSARQRYIIPEEKITILAPSGKPEEKRKNLLLTMAPLMASMLMMVLMRMTMGRNLLYVLLCIGMSGVSIVMAVINYRSDGLDYKKKSVKRENDYNRYIAEQEVKILRLREKERRISQQKIPSVEQELKFVEDFDARLFEKLRTHEDFLWVRLGEGTVESRNQVEYKTPEFRETDDPLMDYPELIHNKYKYIEQMPVVLELEKLNAVGFVGDRNKLYQMVKNLILHFCIEHYYQDVKLFLMMDEQDKPYLEWARWFPNFTDERSGVRQFIYDEDSRKRSLEGLYAELSDREKEKDLKEFPYYIVLVYRSEMIAEHPISKFVEKASALGFCFLFFEEYEEYLNQFCDKCVFLKQNQYAGYIQDIEDGEAIQEFQYQRVSREQAESAALKMACIYMDDINLEAGLTKSISLFQLLGIINVHDLELGTRWGDSKIYKSMAAPLGVKSGNEIVYLDLHEKFHGPHGLVAGTTGSGKSEILQTYILSMATLFHPYEVGFIIIDFKGGGMVNQFRDLPHLNGAITNIDGNEINRSLSAIKAELQKRQRLFAEKEVNHIDDYMKLFKEDKAEIPLPHLILIVDEFAELKSDQPEFMKELISAARIGRSLGVHLILATQKPAGVVNDQIWSNSKFKLCLKVQNQADSNEILRSPLAAEIREPGRAYLQVGNNEIFQLFQSAYSGAPAEHEKGYEKEFQICAVELNGRRKLLYEQKNKDSERKGRTQLDALVDYIADYCKQQNISRLPSVCLPPLPEQIDIASCLGDYSINGIPIGIYDDPGSQYQGEVKFDFCSSNTMIIGAAATGKTNLLQIIIRQIAAKISPQEANIYIMDFGTMYLKNFERLHHVGGVVTLSEEEKLRNLLKLLMEEIQSRKEKFLELGISSFNAYRETGYGEFPQIFLIMDNFNVFRETFADSYEDEFIFILREGLTYGIAVIVANSQVSRLSYKYLSNFSCRISFHCNDSSEYSALFERCRMKPKEIPGRALCKIDKELYELQVFLAFQGEKEIERSKAVKSFVEGVNERFPSQHAKRIPEIPDILDFSYIKENFNYKKQQYLYPIALDYANVDVVHLDFRQMNEVCIVGNEQRRRMEVLTSVLQPVEQNLETQSVKAYIIDNIERPLMSKAEAEYVETYTIDYMAVGEIIVKIAEELERRYEKLINEGIEALKGLPLYLVVINSKEAIEYISSTKNILEMYKNLVKKYKSLGICFVYSDIENIPVAYGAPELLKRFKENKKVFITISNLKEFKFCELPANSVRTSKQLKSGDAYWLNGSTIQRVKLIDM